MPLEEHGIEVDIQNLTSFLSGISKINQAVASIGKQVAKSSEVLGEFGLKFNRVTGQLMDAKGFISAENAARSLVAQLGASGSSASAAVAGVMNLTNAMMGLTGSAQQTDAELRKKPRDLQGVSDASLSVRDVIEELGSGFDKFKLVLGKVGAVIGTVTSVLTAITAPIEKLIGGLSRGASSFGNFFGSIARFGVAIAFGKILDDIRQKIQNLMGTVIDTTAEFQDLEIRFRTLAARDIARQLGSAITPEIKENARGAAQETMNWVRAMALSTRYTAQQIAESLSLANAYDLTRGQSRALIEATNDFASAMGLTGEHIYRIIYNFGQMINQGKITGREFRDLAVSFVPVFDILAEMAKEAGMTTEEFKKLAFEGGVPVTEFLRKFTEMAKRDFKGAAKDMSNTLRGVRDNFMDFINITVGVDILGPVARKIATDLNLIYENTRTTEFREMAMVLGGVLKASFVRVSETITMSLIPALNDLLSALGFTGEKATSLADIVARMATGVAAGVRILSRVIRGITDWINKTFNKVMDNGYTYGYNLISEFARGIASAIKLVVLAIGKIASWISGIFATHSPPKAVPNITKYGKGLMSEYAAGIKQGIDDDIAESIKDIDKVVGQYHFTDQNKGKQDGAAAARDYMAEAWAAVQPLIAEFGDKVMAGIMGSFDRFNFQIFNDISDTVASFIKSLQGMGVDEVDVIPKILGSRKAIAEAIEAVRSGVSTIGDAINKIVKSIGRVPVGFGEYIRAMFDAEAAQRNLTAAQKLSEKTLARADELIRSMSGDVRKFAQSYVDALRIMVQAQEASRIAEEALAVVTKLYEDRLKSLHSQLEQVTDVYDEKRQLQEIDAALATDLLTAGERERLEMERKAILLKREIRETEAARDLEVGAAKEHAEAAKAAEDAAREEAQARQEAMLELAQAQADAAEEQLETTKALIEVQTEQNNLIREQMELLARLAEQAANAGKAMGEAGEGGFGWDPEENPLDLGLPTPEEIQAKVDEIMRNAQAAFLVWKDKMKQSIAEAFGFDSWDQLTADFNLKVVKPIQKAWNDFTLWWNTYVVPSFEFANRTIGPAISGLGSSFKKLGDELGRFGVETNVGKGMGNVIVFFSFFLSKGVAWVMGEVAHQVGYLADQLKVINDVVATVKKAWDDFLLKLAEVADKVAPWAVQIYDAFKQLQDWLVGHSVIPDMMNDIYGIMTGKLTEIATFFGINLPLLQTTWELFSTNVSTNATTTWEAVRGTISTQIGIARDNVATTTADMKKTWEERMESIRAFGDKIWNGAEGIAATVKNGVGELWKQIGQDGSPLDKAVKGALKFLGGLKLGLDDVTGALKNVISEVGNFIAITLSEAFQKARDFWRWLTHQSPSPLALGIQDASKELDKFMLEMNRFSRSSSEMNRVQAPAASSVTNNRNVNVQVNANYANTQSPVSIYYDISAALIASGL